MELWDALNYNIYCYMESQIAGELQFIYIERVITFEN